MYSELIFDQQGPSSIVQHIPHIKLNNCLILTSGEVLKDGRAVHSSSGPNPTRGGGAGLQMTMNSEKLASSVDAIAISKFENITFPVTDRPGLQIGDAIASKNPSQMKVAPQNTLRLEVGGRPDWIV